MNFLHDFTLFVVEKHHIRHISPFPTSYDHFHFHGSARLVPKLILTLHCIIDKRASNNAFNLFHVLVQMSVDVDTNFDRLLFVDLAKRNESNKDIKEFIKVDETN